MTTPSPDLYRKVSKVEFPAEVKSQGTAIPLANAGIGFVERDGPRRVALIVGGWSNGAATAQTVEYDLVTKQLALQPPFPVALSEHVIVTVNATNLVLFGGYDDKKLLGDTYVLSAAGVDKEKPLEWVKVDAGNDTPRPRRQHAMAALGDNVYLFGGFDGEKRLNDLWVFNFPTQQWKCLEAEGQVPAPRDGASLAADAANEQLVMFGGYAHSRMNDVYIFDVSTNSWKFLPVLTDPTATVPSHRFGCAAVVSNNGLFLQVICGQDVSGPVKDVYQLALNSGDVPRWTAVAMDGDEIDPRVHHGWCVADGGKKVLLIGGTNEQKYHSSVLELDFDRPVEVAPTKGKK